MNKKEFGSNEIRQKFLDYYKEKGHAEAPNAPLLPQEDSSLLFVNSGMFPLVPYLLGETHPLGTRLTNSQKCIRTDEFPEIGDRRHTSFFEMLGNWSLNDYFKKEQLAWIYKFLVEELGLDINRLYATVFEGDDNAPRDEESIGILKDIFKNYGLQVNCSDDIYDLEAHIFPYPYKKNWWLRAEAVGELGGPTSEVFYDTGKEHDKTFGEKCHVNCDCGRFIEIGNSVFMQYVMTQDGWEKMDRVNVDFGGGLERLIMVANNKQSIFQTDLFMPVIKYLENCSEKKYLEDPVFDRYFEIVADHIRGSVFMLAENIVPSNKEQGYYLRRLIRRMITFANYFNPPANFSADLATKVIEIMGDYYKHLLDNKDLILENITKEEKIFTKTLNKGLKQFNDIVDSLKGDIIVGDDAFHLLDTYGFPIEMTMELAEEKGLEVDEEGFKQAFKKHQEISRAGADKKFKSGLADSSEIVTQYHSVTHLLHQALREVLGEHVEQKGSNITGDRLRFDFSHGDKMTQEEKEQVEKIINDRIKAGFDVSYEEMTVEKALKSGAIGLFADRYEGLVKVYTFKDKKGKIVSQEICNGPHVDSSEGMGYLKLGKEQSSSAGIRRLKAKFQDK